MVENMKCSHGEDDCGSSVLYLHCKHCMELKLDGVVDKTQPTNPLTAIIDNVRSIVVLKCYFCEQIVHMIDVKGKPQ